MTPEERAKALVDLCSTPEHVRRQMESPGDIYANVPLVAAAIREAVAEEREACAKVAEGWYEDYYADNIAEAIRARGRP